MKKRILSLVVTLVLAVSVLLGASLTSSAADGDGLKDSAISLAENVTLKMEVAIAAPTEGAYAKITLPGNKVDATQLVATAPKAGDNYVFFAEVAVKDLAKNVTIEICNADGTTLVAEATTTALAYCERYLALDGENKFDGLVEALKAYATAADYYFDAAKNADTAASADLSAIADAAIAGELPAGVTHRSATLLLESETTIRHYFELAVGKTVEDYTFFVGNDEVTPETKTLAGATVYYIDIEGLTPNMLDEVYTVKVTDGTDTYTCGYSALTYAKRVYADANSDNDTKNLAAAILAYNSEAGKLKGTTVTFNTNGGSAVANQTYDYGVATPIVATTTKNGAKFLGWFLDEAFTQPISVITPDMSGDVTVYAKWAVVVVENDFESGNSTGFTFNGTEGEVKDGVLIWKGKGGNVGSIHYSNANASFATYFNNDFPRIATYRFDLLLAENQGNGAFRVTAGSAYVAHLFQIDNSGKLTLNKASYQLDKDDALRLELVLDFENKCVDYYVNGVCVDRKEGLSLAEYSQYNIPARCMNFLFNDYTDPTKSFRFENISIYIGNAVNTNTD